MSTTPISVLLNTLNGRYFLLPVTFLSLILSIIAIYYGSRPDIVIFPNPAFTYSPYTDIANGGNSQVLNFQTNDALIHIDFDLKKGFSSPYVGFTVSPKSQDSIDAGGYNQIEITIDGKKINKLGISLFTPLEDEEEAVFHTFLNISDIKKKYAIKIKDLLLPEWWKETHDIPMSENPPLELDKLLHLNIGTAYTPDIEEHMSLNIYEIKLSRNNQKFYFQLIMGQLVISLFVFGLVYFVNSYQSKQKIITIQYEPLSIDKNQSAESFLSYINSQFHNSDLSIEEVAKVTGVSPRKITHAIKEQFDCNFKSYINRIRITESQRLLSLTKLNIGEIAYKVGFNNQSHFNRVFKNELGMSPSEFRDNT